MKKRINIVFFSICFLAALLAEAYCLLILDGDLISVIGIGIVLLIIGYLLLISIREQWLLSSEKAKYYFEQIYSKEVEKWNNRYIELLDLQKASYVASKKNSKMLEEKLEQLIIKVDSVDKKNENSLLRIAELQNKSLEGQKNAVNIEVNYNKENTKMIIKALKEECGKLDLQEQLSLIVSLLEENQIILKNNRTDTQIESSNHYMNTEWDRNDVDHYDPKEIEAVSGDHLEIESEIYDTYHTDNISDLKLTTKPEDTEDTGVTEEENNLKSDDNKDNAEPEIIPLYDDPNKALSADEIASLFASYGK